MKLASVFVWIAFWMGMGVANIDVQQSTTGSWRSVFAVFSLMAIPSGLAYFAGLDAGSKERGGLWR
ncbi:hypothetical protein CBW21_17675 [Chromobacterium violaceum]|uniref:Uncharacterized protein n=1 Tax=Chromobacterium violaceum TaxID=536 RepID=A0A202B5M7_CHRVL|nr:hypothetical protein CBW21_17675 [Chromobacterium violaceum]